MSNDALCYFRKQDITPCGKKFVLMALADYADESDECFPSITHLSSYTSQKDRTVRGHLEALEREGWISRKRSRKEDGTLGGYRYKLHRQISPVANFASGKKLHQPPADSAGHYTSDLPTVSDTSYIPDEAFEAIEIYKSVCVPVGMPDVRAISKKRRSSILARLKEMGMEGWRELCNRAAASDFLSGRTGRFTASIDWLANPNNALKVIEGNYDNRNDRVPPRGGYPDTHQSIAQARRNAWMEAINEEDGGRDRGDPFGSRSEESDKRLCIEGRAIDRTGDGEGSSGDD